MYTITLSDGTVLEKFDFDGKHYICDGEIDLHIFVNNLSPVIINDGEHNTTYSQMELSNVTEEIDDNDNVRTFLELNDITNNMLSQIKLRADIDYLAMLSDIDLDGE